MQAPKTRARLHGGSTGTHVRCTSSRLLVSCFAAILICSPLALAQSSGSRPSPRPNPVPPPVPPAESTFDQNHVYIESNSRRLGGPPSERDTCFLPPLSGIQSPTIGVAAMQIAPKARKDYAAGCSALKDGKYDKAEESLRKAVNDEPKYLAAWITLGQLLAARQKMDDARGACSNAQSADPMYLPSYLCLADIAARSQKWDEVLSFSNRALEIDPTNDPVAYDYNAAANLNLHRLPDAKKSALRAIEIDRNHSDPRVHFLLAQIYEAEGDRASETAQLREFLKFAGPTDAAMVKQYLSELNTKQK
jgi:tetratricopeptide (TPR) repeat protein